MFIEYKNILVNMNNVNSVFVGRKDDNWKRCTLKFTFDGNNYCELGDFDDETKATVEFVKLSFAIDQDEEIIHIIKDS